MLRRPFTVSLLALTLMLLSAVPATAAPGGANHQVRGVATFSTAAPCPAEGGLLMAPQADGWGLDGCLMLMSIDDWHATPSGVYKEYGTERFVGDLVYSKRGQVMTRMTGTFDTTYMITSKWAGEPFASTQYHGRCQHPIVSGTGAFAGVAGRIDIRDTIVDGVAVEFPYWGHLAMRG